MYMTSKMLFFLPKMIIKVTKINTAGELKHHFISELRMIHFLLGIGPCLWNI